MGVLVISLMSIVAGEVFAAQNEPVMTSQPEMAPKKVLGWTPLETFAICETGIAGVSALAGLVPRTVGALTLTGPVWWLTSADWFKHPFRNTATTVVLFTLPVYNILGPNPEGHFKWETAAINFGAINVIFGGVALYKHFFPEKDEDETPGKKEKLSFDLNATSEATVVVTRFRF